MKIKSGEDRGDVDNDGRLDIVKNPITSKGKFDNTPAKTVGAPTVNKANLKMGKTNRGNDGGVEELINGVKDCRIAEEKSVECEITGGLVKLSLRDTEEEVDKVQQKKPVARKTQPSEVDERGGSADEENTNEEGKKKEKCVEKRRSETLVKLAAPSCEDNEEQENEEQKEEVPEEGEALTERGPAYGVAANYDVNSSHNYISNKSCLPYGTTTQQGFQSNNLNGAYIPQMPKNFPVYNNIDNQNVNACGMVSQGKGPKRGMEEKEVYYEPWKFTRPQNAGLPAGADMGVMNNLNAPGNMSNAPPVAVVTGKKVSSVYQKQMSGGTVISPENMPPSVEQFLNGVTGTENQYGANDQLQYNYPSHTGELERQDSIGIPEHWDLDMFGQSVNGDDLLPSGDGYNTDPVDNTHMGNNFQQTQLQGQTGGALPPVSSFTNSATYQSPQHQQFDNYQMQRQPQQPQQFTEPGSVKRGSFGNVYDENSSEGYASDLSPSHDMQFSPTPSPASMMSASPAATINGSPPRTNWSPPPSNMSNFSADSGVCSPMSDDQSGYSTQVQSPGYKIQEKATDYKCQYIDEHLEDLNSALEVASNDLMDEKRRKGIPVGIPYPNSKSTQGSTVVTNPVSISSMTYHAGGQVSGVVPSPAQTFSNSVGQGMSMKYADPKSCPGKQFGQAVNGSVPVAGWNEKQENIPNLPTTVPTVINTTCPKNNVNNSMPSPAANGSKVQQRGKNNNNTTMQSVPLALPVGAVVFTTTSVSSTSPPPVNSNGKIAIPPLQSKAKPGQNGAPFSQFIVNNNGMVTPVFIVSQQNVQTATPPRFPPIAPKDPNKQGDKADVKVKTAQNGVEPSRGTEKLNGGGQAAAKKGSRPTHQLNLARRLVAEMSTNDLKYKDEDGDTYLHVAVCKADHFMVQALLERLVREKLADMIDVQNTMGQTPLYLAVSTNHPEMVQLLVKEGADVNPFAEFILPTGAREKSAAIHCASSKGEKYLTTLNALLTASDINLNQVNSDGHTALHCAILSHGRPSANDSRLNSIPIIKALILAGADPNLQVQQSGKTALMYALESRDLDLIESIFQMMEGSKLPTYLKTQAFDGSTCWKIAESFKASLAGDPCSQQRLSMALKPGPSRGSSSPLSSSSS